MRNPKDEQAILSQILEALKLEGYEKLQFVPFRENLRQFVDDQLFATVQAEMDSLRRRTEGFPILYEHTLSRAYYSNQLGINEAQSRLGRFFLENQRLSSEELKHSDSEAIRLAEPLCESSAQGNQFPWRIVPFFDLLLVVDPVDIREAGRVHLFKDTFSLGIFMKKHFKSSRLTAEIGPGCGTLSLWAARLGAESVVGYDINPRAIDFCRLNAKLNHLDDKVRFELGSDVELWKNESPDTIVVNPPCMFLAPEDQALCSHGGEKLGLEFALRVFDDVRANKTKLFLIIFNASDGTTRYFEKWLPDNPVPLHEETFETLPLDPKYPTQKPLFDAGIKFRELTAFEF